jgi:hypothetical protein
MLTVWTLALWEVESQYKLWDVTWCPSLDPEIEVWLIISMLDSLAVSLVMAGLQANQQVV